MMTKELLEESTANMEELLTANEFWYEEDLNVRKEFDHYEELRKTVMGE